MDYNTMCHRYYYDDGVLYNKRDNHYRAKQGTPCGSYDNDGYLRVKYLYQDYKVHRIIYCLFNECDYHDIEGWEIDHHNNVRDDNHIENLILCESKDNQMNRIDTKRNGTLSFGYYVKNGLDVPDDVRLAYNKSERERYRKRRDT
jgi:hypothetical protein